MRVQKYMNNRDNIKAILMGTIGGLLLAISFGAGYLYHDLSNPSTITSLISNDGENQELGLLLEVQTLLDQVYLREIPDNSTLQYASIRGLLSSLNDPNTFFIEPPVAQSEADVLAGTYGGVGVEIQRNNDGEWILLPYPNSPAILSGIENGDVLLAINGEQLLGTEQADELDQRLRGEVIDGNGVEITIAKATTDEIQLVFIEFDVINIPSVLYRTLIDNSEIGYIHILRFTNRTPNEVQEAIDILENQNIQALVIDLRNNSGGLLLESIAVAEQIIGEGTIVIEKTQSDETIYTANSDPITNLELAVLVNNRTASAAELVASAIIENERGTVFGQKTFGKGTVQQIFSLSDGSSVHITSAEWLTGEGIPLDGNGLIPDIEMIPVNDGRDVELNEAKNYLLQQLGN